MPKVTPRQEQVQRGPSVMHSVERYKYSPREQAKSIDRVVTARHESGEDEPHIVRSVN